MRSESTKGRGMRDMMITFCVRGREIDDFDTVVEWKILICFFGDVQKVLEGSRTLYESAALLLCDR